MANIDNQIKIKCRRSVGKILKLFVYFFSNDHHVYNCKQIVITLERSKHGFSKGQHLSYFIQMEETVKKVAIYPISGIQCGKTFSFI